MPTKGLIKAVPSAVLVGMMGAGKSTIGRRIAVRVSVQFVDVDEEIEQRSGVRITEIFTREGESGFRLRESKVLADCLQLALSCSAVVSTGGGAVLLEVNQAAIKASALPVIYLHCRPAMLYQRLRNDKLRPLLQSANPQETIERLYSVRDPIYRALATYIVEVDGRPSNSMNQVIEALGWVSN
jgi:shikimate kinase